MTDKRPTRRRLLGAASVTLFGLVSGCTGIYRSINATTKRSDSSSNTKPNKNKNKNKNGDKNEDKNQKSTPTSEPTDVEPWTPPKPINTPTQDKLDDRINDVDFINTVESSSGSGYSDFDLQVGANTWMKDVDPTPEEDGNPYFVVKINDVLVARSKPVPFREEGSFPIQIKTGALQQFDPGTLQIRILLLDTDKSRDDLYGEWTGEIKYRP